MGEAKEENVDETETSITQRKQLLLTVPAKNTAELLMAQVKEEKVDETQFLNLQRKELLLTLPPKQATQFSYQTVKPKQEQPDLNLSLTLGSVCWEKSRENQLLSRSSSTIEMATLNMDSDKVDSAFPRSFLSLARACSFPAEAEQKPVCAGAVGGLQTRRVESTNRLLKQGALRARVQKSSAAETMPNSPSKVPAWAAASAAKSPAFCRAIVKLKAHASLPANAQSQAADQVSAANKATNTAPSSLARQVILQAFKDAKALQDAQRKQAHPSKKPKLPTNNGFEETGADMIQKMPSVTTTGPNGKLVEGILYMYRRNQVNIVCICHGRFLTPAEFVRHAGGKDVENPMKHIKVRPSLF